MDEPLPAPSLCRISTPWSVLLKAHHGRATSVGEAQQALMLRYGGAVYRYLLKLLRDPDAADDVAQDFAVRFLRGDFAAVDPGRGRFRDFVRAALRHLVVDRLRRQARRPAVPVADLEVPVEPPEANFDREFLESWRRELLDRAWDALRGGEQAGGPPFYTVLRFRADNPEMRSAAMAGKLSEALGRPVTADWVRKTLERARGRFADFLLEEVRRSLDEPTREAVEEELLAVGLLEYCRGALGRAAGGP